MPSASAGGRSPATKDKYFGFLPGNGIHDIHMNQGNSGRFVQDDGVYQDGGLLVHFPGSAGVGRGVPEVPVAGLAHRRQTGHTIGASTTGSRRPTAEPTDDDPGAGADRRRAGELVQSPEEVVTLINTAPHDVSLDGWALLDTQKTRLPLSGTLAAGATTTVSLAHRWRSRTKAA